MSNILDYFPKGYEPTEIQANVLNVLEKRWNSSKVFVLNLEVACHGKDQGVLLSDGSKKLIQDIKVGDKLLGPDGKPRTVLETHTGVAPLYKVKAFRYGEYIVTGNHVWPLVVDKRVMKKGKVYSFREKEEHLTEVLSTKTLGKKSPYYLYSTGAVDYPAKEYPLDPYILGVWLGDGTSSGSAITSMNEEISDEFYRWVESLGATVRLNVKKGSRAWTFTARTGRGKVNPCLELLKDVGVFKNKHIPEEYFNGSIAQRKELLAGIVDTDGHVFRGIEIIQVNKRLALDIQRLSQSLGYCAKLTEKVINGKSYWRVYICGQGLEDIPTRLDYKKPKDAKRELTNRRFNIEAVGVGEFFGVTVDKDSLYVLDDHTVTHNSGKSFIAYTIASWLSDQEGKRSGARIFTPTTNLVNQYAKDFRATPVARSGGHYLCETKQRRCGAFKPKDRCRGCIYHKAINEANKSNISISTYHMGVVIKNPRQAAIFDEAHRLAESVRSMNSYDIMVHKAHIPFECVGDMDLTKDWVNSLTDSDLKLIKSKKGYPLIELKKDLEERPLNFYTWSRKEWKGGGSVFGQDYKRSEDIIDVPFLLQTPIEVYDKPPMFWQDNQKLILMSATIGRPDLFELGLDKVRPVFIEGDSPIPAENQPIHKDYMSQSMNYKNVDNSVHELVEKIKHYLDTKQGKGVIHITYSLAAKVKKLLDHERLITHSKDDMREKLYQFLSSDNKVFLVSGMYEGVSLDYDKASWQILSKIPWPSLADPMQRYRMEDDPDYYAWTTMKNVIQSAGRVCRRPDDKGSTHIFDPSFEKLMSYKHLVPRNFRERII